MESSQQWKKQKTQDLKAATSAASKGAKEGKAAAVAAQGKSCVDT